MEQKYYCQYGSAFIDHSETRIVLRSNNPRMDEDHAENIMQEYIDDNRNEFKGKKVVSVAQYAPGRFAGNVV